MSVASMTGPTAWTSLEVAKLLVQSLVPLAIFAFGVLVARRAKSWEEAAWQTQKGIEWKQSLFDRTIGNLNKLFCAFNYVGDWRTLAPPEIIKVKRELDGAIYGYKMLLGRETLDAYGGLMNVSFETARGRGKLIKIKANVEMYKEELQDWKDSYTEMFVPPDLRTRRKEFNLLYDKFIAFYFRDVGLSARPSV